MMRHPPKPTPFPYTTLFRSRARRPSVRGPSRRRRSASSACLRKLNAAALEIVEEIARVFLHEGQRQSSDRKSTRLNSSHSQISYAVFCLKKKKKNNNKNGVS